MPDTEREFNCPPSAFGMETIILMRGPRQGRGGGMEYKVHDPAVAGGRLAYVQNTG